MLSPGAPNKYEKNNSLNKNRRRRDGKPCNFSIPTKIIYERYFGCLCVAGMSLADAGL
jgi:hypothetical protein